jgi:hypothetical protein
MPADPPNGMTEPTDRPTPTSTAWERLLSALWVVLAIALLTAAILMQPAASAPAATTPQAAAGSSLEEGEIEIEEEESEEEGEEFEDEEDEEFGTEGPLLFPDDCLLHSAEAQVTTSATHDAVGLTIHYTATTPTNVTVDYWLKGGKGSLQLKEAKQHFAQRGVFRDSEHLSDRAMTKVRAAHAFVVEFDIPAAPAFCSHYATQRLTVKHVTGNQAAWSRSH